MPKADKKQRHRAKREAKRRQIRKRESASPIKRLADAPGEIECWISEDFATLGQVQMFVYKRAAGLTGVACFLVDRGVVGLKDAWTRMKIDPMEFAEMLDEVDRRGITMRRATIGEVRRLVAGGLKWAHQNGMRLPKEWVKTASLIGGVGDWMTADTSEFVMEFAGHPEDLRRRLVTEPFESYIQRTDIAFEFSDLAPYMDQETGEYTHPSRLGLDDDDGDDDGGEDDDLDDEEFQAAAADIPDEDLNKLAARLVPPATGLAKDTEVWLAARNKPASAELVHAWQLVMMASMLSKSAMPDAPEDDVADFGFELLQDMSSRIEPSRQAEFREAVGDVLEHLETDVAMMQRAILKYGMAGDLPEPSDQETSEPVNPGNGASA